MSAIARSRGRGAAFVAAVATAAVIGGAAACGGPDGVSRHPLTVTEPVACDGRTLAVTMAADQFSVRVTNRTGHDCRFSGQLAVRLLGVRSASDPSPASGLLPAGDTYVLPYRVTMSNGCPYGGGTAPGSVQVSVEGEVRTVTVSGQRAHELHDCLTLSPDAASIVS